MSQTFTREARFDLSERKASPGGLKRYPAVISTTTPVTRRDARGKAFAEVLDHSPGAVDSSRAPLPLLEGHDSRKVNVGKVENLRLDGTKLRGDVVLGTSARAEELADDIEAGVVSGLSVGYTIDEARQEDDGATLRATKWTIFEVSLVSIPADKNAGLFRSKTTMDDDKLLARDAAIETERLGYIRGMVKRGNLSATEGAEFEAAKMPFAKVRDLVIDRLAERSESTPIDNHITEEASPYGSRARVTDSSHDKFQRGALAALIARQGPSGVIQQAIDKKLKGFEDIETDPGEFRGAPLLELARESLERRGLSTRLMHREKLASTALNFRGGGLTPAADFTVLYENLMNKTLLGAYLIQQDTWSKFCRVDTVQDFRDSNRYRVGSFGVLDSVPEGEEFKNKSIPDGLKLKISTATKGNIIGLTRQAIINDDMSANSDLAARLGRAAKLSIEVDVYALLAQNGGLGPTQSDSAPFFDSTRGNVNGTGSALSVAGVDADRVLMASQKDITSNEYLDLQPYALVVPTSLGSAAKILNTAPYDYTGSNLMKPNAVMSLFTNVVDSPRISGTRRYLFADPGNAAAIVVAFLAASGTEPFLEQQIGFRTDGIEWKVRLDVAAQMFDPKGAVTNAGA